VAGFFMTASLRRRERRSVLLVPAHQKAAHFQSLGAIIGRSNFVTDDVVELRFDRVAILARIAADCRER
jgi:hypothetical protein